MYYYNKTAQNIVQALKTSSSLGLSTPQIKTRQRKYGKNTVPTQDKKSFFYFLAQQFTNPFIYILVAAALFKLFLQDYKDSLFIIAIIAINAIVGAIQEYRAQTITFSLSKLMPQECTVVRNGTMQVIPDKELVPGDIVTLQAGARIPADGRVIKSSHLTIDQATLTGESYGIRKTNRIINKKNIPVYAQNNMVHQGTYVISGNGIFVVTAIGQATELGKLGASLEFISTPTPLHKTLKSVSKKLVIGTVAITLLLLIMGLIAGKGIVDLLLLLSVLLVSVVPEGLLIALTVILTIGAYRMAQHHVLAHNLSAVEGLGRITTLVVDKTGTLTHNEQMVVRVFTQGKTYSISGSGYEPQGEIKHDGKKVSKKDMSNLHDVATAAYLLDGSYIEYDEQKKNYSVQGEPMQAALGIFAQKTELKKDTILKRYVLINEIPFNSNSMIQKQTWYDKDTEKNVTLISGIPEKVFADCALAKNSHVQKVLQDFLNAGLRSIAIARTDENNNFECVGVIGMQDAIRAQAKDLVSTLTHIGVNVIMATGDHEKTACSIAQQAGITDTCSHSIDGQQFFSAPLSKRIETVKTHTVFYRIAPEQKLELVSCLQKTGHLVAMTGDGVNDVPSLLAADIGITMRSGTDIAQKVADIILLDNALESIVYGIKEGRHIFASLRRVAIFVLSSGLAEITIIFVALMLQYPIPLYATQILWLHLISDGVLDIGLATEARTNHQLSKKSARNILTKKTVQHSLFVGLYMGLISFTAFAPLCAHLDQARTMALVTIGACLWFNAWGLRSEYRSVFSHDLHNNYTLMILTILVVVLQVAAVYTPFLQSILHTVPLAWYHWLIALSVASTTLIIHEVYKKF